MTRTSNYVKGLVSGYGATLATILVGLWLTPFTLRYLDREEYAVFALASDLLMWIGLLDLGITSGLTVQAAQLSGRSEQERLNRLASTAFFTQNLVVLLVLFAGGSLAVGFPHVFPVRQDLQQTAVGLMLVLVAGSAISFSTRTFSALLIANQQVHIDNLLRVALLLIRTVLTVVLLKSGWGLYSLAVANLVATIITSAIAVVRTYRLLSGLRIRWELFSWDLLKSLSTMGVWFSLGGVAGIVIASFDRVVAAKLISIESVTTLTLTGRMYVLSRTFLDQITNTARPMLGQLMGQQKLHEAAKVYNQMFVLSTGLAIVASAGVWAGNGAFVARWVGPQNYGGWSLDLALAFSLLANSWALPNRAALAAGMFKVPQHALARVATAVICLPLAIVMGLHFGLVGIVMSTALAEVAVSCWYLPLLTAQMFKRRFLTLLREDLQPLFGLSLLLMLIALCARQMSDAIGGGFLGAALAGGATIASGATVFWFFSLKADLKKRVLEQVRKIKLRVLGTFVSAAI